MQDGRGLTSTKFVGGRIVVVFVRKSINSGPDTNRTGAKGLSFHNTRLLYFPDQMLEVMMLSQHRISSFKSVRTRVPCGARCMGHVVGTWSAVCSVRAKCFDFKC